MLFNTTLSDMETCYKLFDRRVLDGITIESERLRLRAGDHREGAPARHRIYEVPISYAGREHAEGMKFTRADTVRALATLVKYRFKKMG